MIHSDDRPWPAAIRVAVLLLANGICWAIIIATIVITGALSHGRR